MLNGEESIKQDDNFSEAEISAGDKLISELTAERDKLMDIAQRAQADLVNLRRRMTRDIEEQSKRVKLRWALNVAIVLDQFEMALVNNKADSSGDDWVKGIRLIYDNLSEVLKREGIERFDAAPGAVFDPVWHEALVSVADEKFTDGDIIDQFRPGYKLGNEVIRPAQVRIAANPQSEDENSEQ